MSNKAVYNPLTILETVMISIDFHIDTNFTVLFFLSQLRIIELYTLLGKVYLSLFFVIAYIS